MAKTPSADVSEHDDELKPIMLPSGGMFWAYDREVAYFNERVKKYLKDNHFSNMADLATLDQVLMLEMLVWRWTTWVSQQKDYWDEPINEAGTAKSIKEISGELRQLKTSLGIDKVSRDKQRGEDSVVKYIENLRLRAREFGINREKQLDVALELFNEVKARITLYFNCTPDERQELECTAEQLMEWLRDDVIPTYNKVDEHFRQNKQRLWVREM